MIIILNLRDHALNVLGYDVPVLSKNLDWISVMTYDYHGQWDKKTGHVAPMYTKEDDDDKTFNAVRHLYIFLLSKYILEIKYLSNC